MEEPVRSQARLDQTKRLSNAILRLSLIHISCGRRATSCADQLVKGLREARQAAV